MYSNVSPSAAQSIRCAFCDGIAMTEVMDFGRVALAGGFLRPEHFAQEPTFPLRLYFCQSCCAVQLADIVDPALLFKNYFYFSSAIRTLREHFVDYATEVVSRFLEPPRATVVEIGCNDGILLKPIADQGVSTVIGVDPASNIVGTIDDPRVEVINDFFTETVAEQIGDRYGKADMIVANNVYAHIPNIQGVTRAIHGLLADDGVFIFETHYIGKIVHDLQYDMIYHEHLYYYSLLTLMNHFERFDMEVFDLKPIPIHAGSMRYCVRKKGGRRRTPVSPRVTLLRNDELARGFDRAETYARFAADVLARKVKLMDLLERLRAKGRSVAGYGASGRANTIIQYCGIDHRHIAYMIDDAPAKAGYYTPGSHFVIRGNDVLRQEPPHYLLIFAWSYFNEIAEKCRDYLGTGGRMIVPLPDVRVTLQPTRDDEL